MLKIRYTSIKTFVITITFLSILETAFFSSESTAENNHWELYYENNLASYYYDEQSLIYPYKDNQNIISVWTKTVPNNYLKEGKKQIGYFLYLIYMNCEKVKYRRKEIMTYDVSDELIKRQMGMSTYYTISPESKAESLYKRICP
jgi:hypothetical protein